MIQFNLKAAIATLIIIVLYWNSKLPQPSDIEKEEMVKRFNFSSSVLPKAPTQTSPKFVRKVNPNIEHIAAWASAVGASVAINDLDRDGLANDICYIDNRTDQVIIAPALSTDKRYEPFSLEPIGIDYKTDTLGPSGCLPGDFNEDGNMDVLVYFWGRSPIIYFHSPNNSDAPYKLSKDQYTCQDLIGEAKDWYTSAAVTTDIDGDGHFDLIIGNYFPDGDELFHTDSKVIPTMQHSMSRAGNGGGARFFLWQKPEGRKNNLVFSEVSNIIEPNLSSTWVLAIGVGDLDNDMRPEIYLANDYGNDTLLHNRSDSNAIKFHCLKGKKTLTTPNSKIVGNDSFKGMGAEFVDLNQDGYFDIFVSNIAGAFTLQESHLAFISTGQPELMKQGIAPYVDQSEPLGISRSGWGWDIRLADFDNDSQFEVVQATGFLKGKINRWPELHELAMGNDQLTQRPQVWTRVKSKEAFQGEDLSGHEHNPFYVMSKKGYFFDLAKEIGIDQPTVTRGIAIADVDGDGLLEFATANQWEDSIFYKNNSPKKGHFLGLNIQIPLENQLEQTTVSHGFSVASKMTPAIGTKVIVYLANGKTLVSQVDGGNGHSGKRSSQVHFGLGDIDSNQIVKVKLLWRNASGVHEHTIESLKVDQWYTVNLGK
jgi:hypothetical protein